MRGWYVDDHTLARAVPRTVSSVGRNDLCPCGSGLKFKKCRLGKGATESGAFTDGERRSALNEVFRFSTRREFAEDLAIADLAFWADRLDSSFTTNKPRRDRHRLFIDTVVPLGMVNTGPGFSEYRANR